MASLYIKDAATAEMVSRLARQLGSTKTEAVRRAVQASLDRRADGDPETDPQARTIEWIDARMADFYRRFPPIDLAGVTLDKAFWDEVGGEA